MPTQQQLNKEIEAAYAKHKSLLPKKEKKKKYSKIEHLSHVMAWAMLFLTLTGLLLTALISTGTI